MPDEKNNINPMCARCCPPRNAQQEESELRESWTHKLQCPGKQTADERLTAVDKQRLSLLKIIIIIIIMIMSDKIKKSKTMRCINHFTKCVQQTTVM